MRTCRKLSISVKIPGDLTILWLDAYGDLNTPGESAASLFYGMPLRALMDELCFGLLENRYPLTPPQVIHVGGRDFDEAESAFI
ncbi:MAG: arginase family protein [Eubacteriaceae bacterium]|nr:arginase family protein [Eubacteriaceae bacterium]